MKTEPENLTEKQNNENAEKYIPGDMTSLKVECTVCTGDGTAASPSLPAAAAADNPISRFCGRTNRFFSVHKRLETLFSCLFLSAFILIVFTVFLIIYDIFPFGKNCMSSYDMLAQIAPFIEHFYDVADGRSSLFYTYAIAGGADVFGTLAYCCISPFTFIFLLFGRGNVYYGTSIVLPLKMVCVALSVFFYLKKRFKNLPALWSTGLSLAYTFCGYLFVSNTYINWVDLLIYLPWAAYGFYKLTVSGSKWLFILSLSLMVYTSFSITSFSFFLIFPIAIMYCLFCLRGKERKERVFDTVLSFLCVVMFCLPVLLPSFVAIMNSARKTSLFENLMKEIKLGPLSETLYKKISYILTDSFTLFFTCMYFYKSSLKKPFDRFLLITGLMILVPVIVDESCNLLNFGSYMSYSLRFGFLNGFYALFVAALFLNNFYIERKQKKVPKPAAETEETATEPVCDNIPDNVCPESAGENTPDNVCPASAGKKPLKKKRKKKKKPAKTYEYSFKKDIKYSCVLMFLAVISLIALCLLSYGLKYADKTSGDTIFGKWFSSRFAHSLGGLEATSVIFAMTAAISLLGALFISHKRVSVFSLSLIMMFLLCGQMVFYTDHLVRGNRKSVDSFDKMQVITDYIEKTEGNKYTRVKMWDDYLTCDMPFTMHNVTEYSIFSSALDSHNFAAPIFLSYMGNKKNTIKTYNTRFYSDCIMGNKYFIDNPTWTDKNRRKLKDCYANDKYLKQIEIKDENGRTKDTGNYVLYENLCALPPAFAVDNAQTEMDGKNTNREWDRVMKMLGGKTMDWTDRTNKKMMKKLHDLAAGQDVDLKLEPDKITVKLNAEKDKYLFVHYVCLPGHKCYVNGTEREFCGNPLNFMLIPLDEGENEVKIIYKSPYINLILYGIAAALLFALLYWLLFILWKKPAKFFCTATYIAAIVFAGLLVAFFLIMPICVFVYKAVITGYHFITADGHQSSS